MSAFRIFWGNTPPADGGNQTVSLSGVAAAVAAGAVTVSVQQDVTVTVSGVAAAATVGSVTVQTSADATVPVTGIAAVAAAGSITTRADATIALSGASVAAVAGTATVSTEGNVTVALVGASATAALGAVGLEVSSVIALSGIATAASVGDVTATAGTPQYARPSSDVDATGWSASGGGALYLMIDEATYNDADYIYTETENADCEVALGAVTDPASSTGHVVRFRARAPYDGQVKVGLYQGAALVAEWTDALTMGFADYEHTLSGAQADAITDYTALRYRFTALAA